MKQNGNINVNRMLILPFVKKKQNKWCLNLTVYIFFEGNILQDYKSSGIIY